MSIQGVFNTRLSEKIGLYESNVFVQATALIFGIIAMFILGKGSFAELKQVNMLYLSGGLIGTIITITVMLGITYLKPTTAISTILISQLITAALIDAFGLFGSEKTALGWQSLAGITLMICGIVFIKSASQ